VKTEDLIVELARSAAPVTPLPSPAVRFARWAAGCAVLLVAFVAVAGLRPTITGDLARGGFDALAIATLATGLGAGAVAFALSVPGTVRTPLVRALPLAAGGVWFVLLAAWFLRGADAGAGASSVPVHLFCIAAITGLSLIPGAILLRMIGRAAPLEPSWAAALASLAALAMAAAAVQFTCPIDTPAHHLISHFLPVTLLTVAGMRIGSRRLG
jgi:hypothetical protein